MQEINIETYQKKKEAKRECQRERNMNTEKIKTIQKKLLWFKEDKKINY